MNARNVESTPPLQLSARIWRGVTLQLFLVAVLPLIVLVLLVTFGSLHLHHEAMRALVADRNLRAVQSAAAGLSLGIEQRGAILEILLRSAAPGQPPEILLTRAEQDLVIFEGGVAALDAQGRPAAFLGDPAIQSLVQGPDWVQTWQAARAANPGEAFYLPVRTIDGQQYAPVIVQDGERGALAGLFSPQALLARGLAAVSNSDPVTVLVVNQRMEILYQNGKLDAVADLTTHPGIQNALEGSSGIDYLQTTDGEHVITYSPISPEGWALLIEESWEDIASPLLRATQNAPLIIVPILALSLLALWFGMRQIVQPIQALEGKAGDLARGDFESIRQPVGGVPEIRRLQETLIDMSVQLKEAQNSLHNYIGAITASVENERHNLARELHDGTIQTLIALGQYTQYALHWNQDARVEKTLNQVLHLNEQGMKDLRQLIRGLRPIYIEDLGLSTALAMHATQGDRLDGTQVHFGQEGKERRMPPEVEMALYRMAQEALNNVHRHASAKNAWITLRFGSDEVTLEVQDDGQGFDLPADPTHYARLGHYGLLGLYERADLIGAQLTIHSKPAQGTRVHVRLSAPAENRLETMPDQTAKGT